MIDPRLCQCPKESIGASETYTVPGADRSVAEGLGQERLTDPYRTDKECMFVTIEEVQRENGIEQAAIHGDTGLPIEVFKPTDLFESCLLEVCPP